MSKRERERKKEEKIEKEERKESEKEREREVEREVEREAASQPFRWFYFCCPLFGAFSVSPSVSPSLSLLLCLPFTILCSFLCLSHALVLRWVLIKQMLMHSTAQTESSFVFLKHPIEVWGWLCNVSF